MVGCMLSAATKSLVADSIVGTHSELAVDLGSIRRSEFHSRAMGGPLSEFGYAAAGTAVAMLDSTSIRIRALNGLINTRCTFKALSFCSSA